jgi:ketosteroid isomerase-like protein
MAEVTREQVESAYRSLGTGSREEIAKHYDENVRWLVPGNHPLAGWYHGLDAFLDLMARAGKLSGGSFAMERLAILTGEDCSADLCRNTGLRQGAQADSRSPYDRLDSLVFHFMKWRDGRIVEGRDGLFGDDATAFSQFWSPLDATGNRYLAEDA